MTDSGDLGRRVASRRLALGLSRDQVAERAGVAASFVAVLEGSPVTVTSEAVSRLAAALVTTPEVLLGADIDLPAGRGQAGAHAELQALPISECLRLIAPGGVGRVALNTDAGPETLPVNYVLDDTKGGVLFRGRENGIFARHVGNLVGFEVDRIDDPERAGWSVLINGHLQHLPLPPDRLRDAVRVTPWAGGDRDLYLRIEIERISGRWIRTG